MQDRGRNFKKKRDRMVETQLIRRGIKDQDVLRVMGKVPRHRFVPEDLIDSAYDDCPLPIGEGQTISQPYMVAVMTQSLELCGYENVLEIGSGSGYQAAILAELSRKVYIVERIEVLMVRSRQILKELGYTNVVGIVGDGTCGLPEFSPFDGIIVSAGAPEVIENLTEQLVDGGRLVIPVGGRYSQELVVMHKLCGSLEKKTVCGCVFVPLIGEHGWKG